MPINDYKQNMDKQIEEIQLIKRMVQDLNNEIDEDKIWDIINELSNLQDML